MKVASSLSSKQIENFCPGNMKFSSSFLRARLQNEVLLPSYVFVRATDEEIRTILKMRHVISLVFWKNNPVELPDEYIQALRLFSTKNQNISIQRLFINNSIESKITRIISDSSEELILPAMGFKLSARKIAQREAGVRVLVTDEMKEIKDSMNTIIKTGS